jgi:cell division septation protein DedD
LPPTYQMRHDAHYVEELDARTLSGRATRSDAAIETPVGPKGASSPHEAAGKRLASLVAVAALGVMLSAAGMWFVRSAASRTPQARVEPAPEPMTARDEPLPVASQMPEAASTTPAPAPAAASGPRSTGSAPRFAVQMATFRTKARAIEAIRELGAAGYTAFSAEVELRDGVRAFTVSLGPYGERAAAAEDLQRAQRTPGYGMGRVVELDQ